MNINKLNKKLNTLFNGKVKAIETAYSFELSGNLDNYDDILKACRLAVDKKSGKHVVNNIVLNGYKPKDIRKPNIEDKSLDNAHPDVLVIGGGVNGAAVLRELSRYDLDLLLVDKEADLANHASGRNDGEIHPGVDLKKGSLKYAYVKRGNRMYDQVSKELDVPFRRIGQYAAFTEWFMGLPLFLLALNKKYICGINDTKLVGRNHLRKLDSKLNKDFKWAIYNPMSGIISPYELTIAYAENAVCNGAKVSLNTYVKDMKVKDGRITEVITNRGTIYPRVVINAAGCFADDIAKMANDRFYSIHPRRGTDIIFDKKTSSLIKTISSIQQLKKNKTHSKGGGSLETIHHNVLCGPDAVECLDKEDFSTYKESIDNVINKQKNTVEGLNRKDIITYFTGIRASNFEEDFVLGRGKNTKNLVHIACMQSPGLTTAPAVSIDMARLTVEILKEEKDVKENINFNPIRHGIPRVNEMSIEKRNELIKRNPDYGVIVCRCEEISKGEIIDALNSPIPVATIDGVKRRVRPGMGRCQGTFCMPLVAKIISKHENIDMKDVNKGAVGTSIGIRNSKDIHYE